MMKTLLRLAPLALLFAGVAAAQSTGVITGTVTDGSTGQPVVGAMVTASSPASGDKTTVTDAKGGFSISGLPAGQYKLQAVMDNYKPEMRADLTLGDNVTLRANLAIVPTVVQMEEVVVTGSRIKRKDLTAPAPVTVVSKDQIQATGRLAIGDFLQLLPEQAGGTNTTVNNGGDGSTTVSLRGLGSNRTLVLIDGKRFISGVPGGGNLGDPGTDLNSIPAGAVERIEILKDGASAVYGSDAIGGVVNIITRKRINGVEASYSVSNSEHNDAGVQDFNVLAGTSNDKGGFALGAGYYKQDALFAANRGWANTALTYDYSAGETFPGGSSRIPQGRATINLDDPSCAGNALCNAISGAYYSQVTPNGAGQHIISLLPSTTTFNSTTNPVVTVGSQSWRRYSSSHDAYNFQAVNYLITPSERVSLYGNGDYQLTDWAKAYFHATYVERRSANMLAPVPLDTGSFGLTMSAQNYYNPFGQDLTDVRRRFLEGGGRSQEQDIATLHTFAGLQGSLPAVFGPLERWTWDVSFGYARNDGVFTTHGSINTQLTGNAIGPSSADGSQCLTSGGQVIPGCTPANWFNAGTTPMTPAMAASLGAFTGTNSGSNAIRSVDASIGGDLFKLMADRPVALAVGYAYREETGKFTYNPIAVAGLDSDYNGLDTQGKYHANEGYGELNIPILSNMPFVEALEAVAAARVANYSSFGSNTTYKFGARWTPIRDFTVRGTVSTGYRAPGITSLYGGQGPNAEASIDPCANTHGNATLNTQCAVALARGGGGAVAVNNGDPNNQILSTSGGNPDLKPEKADIFTVGVVIEPSVAPGLSVTVDYYNINIKDNIGFITTPVILQGCYTGTSTPQNVGYCNKIQRSPVNGQIRDVTDTLQNVGKLDTNGIDVAARYSLPTSVGRFGVMGDATFLLKYNQTLADGTLVKGVGNYDLGANPDYRFNIGASWAYAGFQANLLGRFIGGFKECADPDGLSSGSGLCYADTSGLAPHKVPFYQTYDLNLAYSFKYGLGTAMIAAGVRNLLNKDPAPVYNTAAQTNSDPTTYDYVGRAYYLTLSHKF